MAVCRWISDGAPFFVSHWAPWPQQTAFHPHSILPPWSFQHGHAPSWNFTALVAEPAEIQSRPRNSSVGGREGRLVCVTFPILNGLIRRPCFSRLGKISNMMSSQKNELSWLQRWIVTPQAPKSRNASRFGCQGTGSHIETWLFCCKSPRMVKSSICDYHCSNKLKIAALVGECDFAPPTDSFQVSHAIWVSGSQTSPPRRLLPPSPPQLPPPPHRNGKKLVTSDTRVDMKWKNTIIIAYFRINVAQFTIELMKKRGTFCQRSSAAVATAIQVTWITGDASFTFCCVALFALSAESLAYNSHANHEQLWRHDTF